MKYGHRQNSVMVHRGINLGFKANTVNMVKDFIEQIFQCPN